MTRLRRLLGQLAGAAILAGFLFGVLVAVALPFEWQAKAAAEDWPARPARITKAFVSSHAGSGRHGPYDEPTICGVWLDSEEPFCVTRVRYGDFRWGRGEAAARATVARYPVGSEVPVHHDPADRRITVLEARTPWTTLQWLLGLGVAGLALPFMLWGLGRLRRPADPPTRN